MKLSAKKILFAFVILAASCFVILTAAELMLRYRERTQMERLKQAENKSVVPSDIPGLNYTLAPGHRKDGIDFNSHGFNMPERSIERGPGSLRVMFVGDSVTQGVGIEKTPQAYPNRVDAKLAERAGPDRFDVWNCGTGGYNARQVLIQMREILPPYDPDVIVYGFNFNDYWPPYQFFHGQPGLPPEENVRAANEGLLDWLKQFRVVLQIRDAINSAVHRFRGYAPVYVDRKISYPSWERMKGVIAEMDAYCGEQGIGFAVVIHPNEQFFYRDAAENLAHADITAFLDEQQIPYFDLLDPLREHRKEDLFLPDGNHMTPHGYELAARAVTSWMLTRTNLFPPTGNTP